MKAPFWKRLLSHFYEFHIESAPSEHNPHLYVSLSRGRYQLSTENAIYSYGDLYSNFVRAFLRLNLDKLNIEEVLILGFGLGSIPVILEKKYDKKYYYTAVEIDENVLYLANKYTLPEIKSSIQTICTDAFSFAEITEQKFDLICMDIFLDDVIPEEFEGSYFLENLASMLHTEGVLLYNRLSLTEEDKVKSKTFLEEKFLRVFPEGQILDVGGNWILLNRKSAAL